jgi:tRNA-uridine 2-sulfurtransferase
MRLRYNEVGTNLMPSPDTHAELTAVAMSGGVDSSTVAALLLERNSRIVGLTMQLWNQRRLPALAPVGRTHRCCSLEDVHDAKRVAEHLRFPHYVVNFEEQFEASVVRPFVDEYLQGRTPIPCTLCNNHVKFEQLLVTARQIGAERLATGHYARIRFNQVTGRYELLRARDLHKDQSYFLMGLRQEQMQRTSFPLGELRKEAVRAVARAAHLPVAEKPESQEICFVPQGNYVRFIEAYREEQGALLTEAGGEIVTTDGEVLGRHSGVHQFTVGQRKGLGFAAGKPHYVVAIDPANRRVIVGNDAELRRTECEVRDVNWISVSSLRLPVRGTVKIRNRHEAAAATIAPLENEGGVRVLFDEPQRAITPGQAAAFYQGDVVLGGGWIV